MAREGCDIISIRARLHLSVVSAGLLEKLKTLPAVVQRKLGDSVTVPVYATHVASLKGAKETVKDRSLYPGKALHHLSVHHMQRGAFSHRQSCILPKLRSRVK